MKTFKTFDRVVACIKAFRVIVSSLAEP